MTSRTLQPHLPTGPILVAILVWFGSYVYQFVYSLGGPKPFYSYFLLMGIAFTWLLFHGMLGKSILVGCKRGIIALFVWLGLYFVYGVFAFENSTKDEIALQAFVRLGETVVLLAAFVTVMAGPRQIRLAQKTLMALALGAVALNLWDFFVPTFSKVPGRAAGLYVNPNTSGYFIAVAMMGGLSAVPRRLRVLYLLSCGLGVLVTFSRSSWILWIIAILWLFWNAHSIGSRPRLTRLVLALSIGSILILGSVAAPITKLTLSSYLTPNTMHRLGLTNSSALSDYAASSRIHLIGFSFHEAASAPLLGHGLGYTNEWGLSVGPHNMYLLFLVEGGGIGLALYLGLMFLLWRHSFGIGRAIAWQLWVAGLFSHNQLEQPAFLIIIVFVIMHGAIMRRRTRYMIPSTV